MKSSKLNETFVLLDNTDDFILHGSATFEQDGSVSMSFDILNPQELHLGHSYYSKTLISSEISFGINCSEENLDKLVDYIKTLIPQVLNLNKD